jgi:hypothetical protein
MGLGWDDVRLPNPVRPSDEFDLEMTVKMRAIAFGSPPDRKMLMCKDWIRPTLLPK